MEPKYGENIPDGLSWGTDQYEIIQILSLSCGRVGIVMDRSKPFSSLYSLHSQQIWNKT